MVLTIAAVAFAVRKQPELVLLDADSRRRYGSWPAPDGVTFSVEFIHSVNQSVVCDYFTVRGGKIVATATRYSAFGAGVQTELAKGESLSYDEDGSMLISGIDKEFDKLNYIVGTVSDHILTIEGEPISLTALCGKNAAVVFEIK